MDGACRVEVVEDLFSLPERRAPRRPEPPVVVAYLLATALELLGVVAVLTYGAVQLARDPVPGELRGVLAGSLYSEPVAWWRLLVFASAGALLALAFAGGLASVASLLRVAPVSDRDAAVGRYAVLATGGLNLAISTGAILTLATLTGASNPPLADLALGAAVEALALAGGLLGVGVLWLSRARLARRPATVSLLAAASLAGALALALQVGAGAFVIQPGPGPATLPVLQQGFHSPRLVGYRSALDVVQGAACPDASRCAITASEVPATTTAAVAGPVPGRYAVLEATGDGGLRWHAEQLSVPSGSEIEAPACVGSRCLLVERDPAGGTSTVLEVSPWAASPAPRTLASLDGLLSAFSCTTAGTCMATLSRPDGTTAVVRSVDLGTRQTVALPPPLADGVSWAGSASCSGTSCFLTGRITGDHGWSTSFAFATTDGGTTWVPTDVPSGATAPRSVSCTSEGACIAAESAAGGAGSILLTSADGGVDWTGSWSLPGTVSGVACPPSGGCTAMVDERYGETMLTAAFDAFPLDGSAVQMIERTLRPGVVRLGGVDLLACPTTQRCFASVEAAVTGADGVARRTALLGERGVVGSNWAFAPLPDPSGSN